MREGGQTQEDKAHEEKAVRLRRLRFRAWHRGFQELDLIMGHFADRYADQFDEGELAAFEALLEAPDTEVYHWIIGKAPVPAVHEGEMMRRLQRLDYLKPVSSS